MSNAPRAGGQAQRGGLVRDGAVVQQGGVRHAEGELRQRRRARGRQLGQRLGVDIKII